MIPRGKSLLLLCLTILAASCGTNDSPSTGTPAPANSSGTAGATKAAPAAVLADGARLAIEIAADADTRAQGLMFRPSLSADRGMLFIFPQQDVYPFWMKNTLIPLDMIWLDSNRKVVHVAAAVPPCTADPCPSYSPSAAALYVLELSSGQAAAHSIKPGDTIRFEGIENIAAR